MIILSLLSCLLVAGCLRQGADDRGATAGTDTAAATYTIDSSRHVDTPALPRHTGEPYDNDATDTLYGDFDGDGKREYVWVQNPVVVMDSFDCEGGCNCLLRSSDSTMKPISTPDCIGGHLINYGDLNGDGGDEVGMIPVWFTSCWGRHFLFTLRDHKWINAIPGSTLRCESYDDTAIVRLDPRHPGYVILKYYDMDSGFDVLEKSVKLQ